MRQFFESLIVFQLITCRYSPVHRFYKLNSASKKAARLKKWAVYAAIMLIAAIFQLKLFTMCKHISQ
jgi:hypothetical protein